MEHTRACPYVAIEGYFEVISARMSNLNEENTLLKHKVDVLEGMMQAMRREMASVKSALGPWCRSDGQISTTIHRNSVDSEPYGNSTFGVGSSTAPLSPQPIPRPDHIRTQSMASVYDPISPHLDDLAPYFPPELTSPEQPSSTSRNLIHTHVAPINLSGSLEGSFGSLREDLVSLSDSLDSLARRQDIAQANESRRINEELMSMRGNIHGLRMQVHRIMMDRNAQVTGRGGDLEPFEGNTGPFFYPGALPTPFTKL